MSNWEGAHRTVDCIARWPGIAGMLRRRYEREFASNRDRNLFRGVFESFDEARLSAPTGRPLGYDNSDAAAMYVDRTRRIYPTDYPVLYWLQRLFAAGCTRVFDLGGHIGVSYYAYRRYLDYPANLEWRVHDVPAVMAQGRRFAAQKDRDGRLGFLDRFEEADGFDVLVAQGSVQYLPEALDARLARLARPPRHVILNLTPLHETHAYFTLQSIGTAFCPYRIEAVGDFLGRYQSLGYEIADAWDNPDKRCEIPFHPDRSLDRYHGFHFRRATG